MKRNRGFCNISKEKKLAPFSIHMKTVVSVLCQLQNKSYCLSHSALMKYAVYHSYIDLETDSQTERLTHSMLSFSTWKKPDLQQWGPGVWDPLLMKKHPFRQKLWVQLASHQSAAPAANGKSAGHIPTIAHLRKASCTLAMAWGGTLWWYQVCREQWGNPDDQWLKKAHCPCLSDPLKLQRILANT